MSPYINICILAIVFSVSACSLNKRAPMKIYKLESAKIVKASCTSPDNLQIAVPSASEGLDSNRIIILQSDQQLNFYNGVRWAGPVTGIMQNLLIDGFEDAGGFNNVSDDMDPVSTDLRLATDIRDFQVIDDKNPVVKIRLVSKLTNDDTGKVIRTIRAEKIVKPEANKMDAIVIAFNKATGDVIAEIIDQTTRSVGCNN